LTWRDQGCLAEARSLLAPVYRSFTESFAFPDLVDARALLHELGEAEARALLIHPEATLRGRLP